MARNIQARHNAPRPGALPRSARTAAHSTTSRPSFSRPGSICAPAKPGPASRQPIPSHKGAGRATLASPLRTMRLELSFAHLAFGWGSDARGTAHAHVVILELAKSAEAPGKRRLYT